jgi:hypothetical protein
MFNYLERIFQQAKYQWENFMFWIKSKILEVLNVKQPHRYVAKIEVQLLIERGLSLQAAYDNVKWFVNNLTESRDLNRLFEGTLRLF